MNCVVKPCYPSEGPLAIFFDELEMIVNKYRLNRLIQWQQECRDR